jgi:hypothetical protein
MSEKLLFVAYFAIPICAMIDLRLSFHYSNLVAAQSEAMPFIITDLFLQQQEN